MGPPPGNPSALLAMLGGQDATFAPGGAISPQGDMQGNPLLALLEQAGIPPGSVPPEMLEALLAELLGGQGMPPMGGGMPMPGPAPMSTPTGMPMNAMGMVGAGGY